MGRSPLFTAPAVLSFRHLPTWLLLCSGAGLVNAGAFLAIQRFASHVTGTVTQAGLGAGMWLLMAEYGLVLLCFVFGAFVAVWPVGDAQRAGRKSAVHALPLFLVSTLLLLCAAVGSAGGFGPFGGSAEEPADFVFLSLLSLAMGLQNAAVAASTGMLVRTTHLTGPATDLGINLATAALSHGETRKTALRGALLRGGKILAFCAGAAAMVPLAARLGFAAFAVPAFVVLAATALSFIPSWSLQPFVSKSSPQPSSGEK